MEEFDAAEQVRRIEDLQNYLERELCVLRKHLEELKTDKAYETPPDILAQTADWNRGTKMLGTKRGSIKAGLLVSNGL
jgi:hypothetical protein